MRAKSSETQVPFSNCTPQKLSDMNKDSLVLQFSPFGQIDSPCATEPKPESKLNTLNLQPFSRHQVELSLEIRQLLYFVNFFEQGISAALLRRFDPSGFDKKLQSMISQKLIFWNQRNKL